MSKQVKTGVNAKQRGLLETKMSIPWSSESSSRGSSLKKTSPPDNGRDETTDLDTI